MCGLFASLSLKGPIRADYTRSLDMIAHRGPDGSGQALVDLLAGAEADRAGRAWLGHRRLSIIDPDPRANQPMFAADDRFAIVYNGEIYNYLELQRECRNAGWVFRTQSDTEVLLASWALWGEAALSRFIGMFAFVLVDRVESCAWIARDPFGIKPLHYAMAGDELLLSSEIAPLMATGRVALDIDAAQSADYIRFGASPAVEETLITGVRRFPPASVARFDFASGKLSTPRRFWQPARDERRIGFADAVAECRERFLANVRLHLRSDVPVGAALSGGLDSSAIVCAVHHLEPDLRLNTFSFISADPAQSEERWVDIVNAHIGAVEHKVRPEPDDLSADLEALVRAQGEPFGSASIYAQYRVFRMARQAGVPVTLDGQGADELLAGYWPYVATHGAHLLRHGKPLAAAQLIWSGADGMATRVRLAAQLGQAALPARMTANFRKLIGRELMPDFLNAEWFADRGIRAETMAAAMLTKHADLRSHLVDTVERSSLPTLLRIADRSSMAFSVESRVPFLTPDFADFLLSLPAGHIVSPAGERKYLFREAMRGILPEPVRARRDKIGFAADDGLWLRRNEAAFRRYIDLLDDAPQFQQANMRRYVEGFFAGGKQSAQQVWRIFMFAIWLANMRGLVQR